MELAIPCFVQIGLQGKAGRNSAIAILSVAQFRPEKDHPLQLKALANFLKKQPGMRGKVSGGGAAVACGPAVAVAVAVAVARAVARAVL